MNFIPENFTLTCYRSEIVIIKARSFEMTIFQSIPKGHFRHASLWNLITLTKIEMINKQEHPPSNI